MSIKRRRILEIAGGGGGFNGYLYKEGDECTSVTGGWKNIYLQDGGYSGTHTFTKNPSDMYLSLYRYGVNAVITELKCEVNGTLKVQFDVQFDTQAITKLSVVRLGIFTSYPTSYNDYVNALQNNDLVQYLFNSPATDYIGEIALNKTGFVTVSLYGGGSDQNQNMTIKNIWVE